MKAWSEIIEEFYTLIDGYLTDTLVMSSNNNNSEAWRSISTVYIRLGKVKSLQEAIQSDLWQPLIQKVIIHDSLDAIDTRRWSPKIVLRL